MDSQEKKGERVFMSKDFIYDITRTRGVQIGCKYTEAYETIRIVI